MPGQLGKTAPLKPGKYGIFPVMSLFFYPSLLKTRHFQPNKKYFLEISNTRAIISQSLNVLTFKIVVMTGI